MNPVVLFDKKILDHGFIRLVETWGSDESIISAARMSTQKGFEGWGPREDGKPGDEKLLAYLYKKKHSTPFEMAGMVIEVQAPIFVFREWMRHRTQSYNEASARYAPLPNLNYIPTVERLMMGGGTNKQAGTISNAQELTEENASRFRDDLQFQYEGQQAFYMDVLEAGVPKELARLVLPVGRYSRMRACANLRNWLAFMTLRSAKDAQWEIRQYSIAIGEFVEQYFPRTWKLFVGEQ